MGSLPPFWRPILAVLSVLILATFSDKIMPEFLPSQLYLFYPHVPGLSLIYRRTWEQIPIWTFWSSACNVPHLVSFFAVINIPIISLFCHTCFAVPLCSKNISSRCASWRWTADAPATRSSWRTLERRTSWWVRHSPLDQQGDQRPATNVISRYGHVVMQWCCLMFYIWNSGIFIYIQDCCATDAKRLRITRDLPPLLMHPERLERNAKQNFTGILQVSNSYN